MWISTDLLLTFINRVGCYTRQYILGNLKTEQDHKLIYLLSVTF